MRTIPAMKASLTALVCLLWTGSAAPQTPPDTFYAGIGGYQTPFFVGPGVDSGKIAILLPAAISGRMITSISTYFASPNGGPVSSETWKESAAFAWGLSVGTGVEPGSPTVYTAPVELKTNTDLRIGGMVETAVEWPAIEGNTYWLIGYWQKDADFIRLGRNQLDLEETLLFGFEDSNSQLWQTWTNSGFVVEVAYGFPDEGVPSGILDPDGPSARGASQAIRADITGDRLSISLYPSSMSSYQPYELLVVNVLGQTVVSGAGIVGDRSSTDFGEISVPWSARHPSGVYFCRIRLGGASHTVSIVNLK